MAKENLSGGNSLEKSFFEKEIGLPKSIRDYIRRLKADGQLKKALEISDKVRESKSRKREERAQEELRLTIFKLLETEDSLVQGEYELKALWLLEASGIINSEERLKDLLESLDSKAPALKEHLEKRLVAIREQVEPLLSSPNSQISGKRRIRH